MSDENTNLENQNSQSTESRQGGGSSTDSSGRQSRDDRSGRSGDRYERSDRGGGYGRGDRDDRGDRGGYRGGGGGGGGGGRGRSYFRRKVCRFCTQNLVADYKNPDLLRRFVTERGKILPRRITGTCAKHQRALSVQIKRARTLAFLPFTKQ